jgi:hypothetical protein
LHERGEDENLKESMHRYINTNEWKKGMFNKFNTEEKYSRLDVSRHAKIAHLIKSPAVCRSPNLNLLITTTHRSIIITPTTNPRRFSA